MFKNSFFKLRLTSMIFNFNLLIQLVKLVRHFEQIDILIEVQKPNMNVLRLIKQSNSILESNSLRKKLFKSFV
jgi:hypothetical protein